MHPRRPHLVVLLCAAFLGAGAFAQFRGGGGFRRGGRGGEPDARNVERGNVPRWDLDPAFGTATSRFGYQLPRTFRMSFGVRF